MRRLRSLLRRGDDAGLTVVEITVASALLLAALTGMLGVMNTLHRTASYEAGRNRSLDDLRITAGAFGKDARHASQVLLAAEDEVKLHTYVNGALKEVTYRVVTSGGETNLVRHETGAGERIFVIRLTDDSIFTFEPNDPTRPEDIRFIGIHMESRPRVNDPPVVLETEVLLRNVDA